MPASRPVTKPTPRHAARKLYSKVPRKTVADDPESYTKNPHEYGDILIRPNSDGQTKLGGALQRDLVYWIERNTWGKNIGTPQRVERPEFAKLSLADLAKLCGSDRRTVARSLADLEKRQIIQARDRGADLGPNAEKMYKLTPARWKKAPYYDPNSETMCRPRKVDATPAEAAPEESVEPGKVSKPQPVAVSLSKGAPEVTVRISYRPLDFPFPVAFSTRPGRNGRLQMTCRATTPQRFAVLSPSVNDVSVESERLEAYSDSISSIVLDIWNKEADRKLIDSIVSAAGTAPVWLFESLIEQKFPKRRNPQNHVTGLLIGIAEDAAKGQLARERADAKAAERREANGKAWIQPE